MSVISNWVEALQTTHLREGIEPDPVSRWLIITRAAVIPMTFFSATIGGLLAVPGGNASLGLWVLGIWTLAVLGSLPRARRSDHAGSLPAEQAGHAEHHPRTGGGEGTC